MYSYFRGQHHEKYFDNTYQQHIRKHDYFIFIEFFGHGSLAKELDEEAGIDASIDWDDEAQS